MVSAEYAAEKERMRAGGKPKLTLNPGQRRSGSLKRSLKHVILSHTLSILLSLPSSSSTSNSLALFVNDAIGKAKNAIRFDQWIISFSI